MEAIAAGIEAGGDCEEARQAEPPAAHGSRVTLTPARSRLAAAPRPVGVGVVTALPAETMGP